MKLYLDKAVLVEEVKKMFTGFYPFLKIELYKKPVTANAVIKKEFLSPALTFDALVKRAATKTIDINNNITVAELEEQFAEIGILIEVLRRSGNVWVGTSLTRNWTLQQQNEAGEEISKHFGNSISL